MSTKLMFLAKLLTALILYGSLDAEKDAPSCVYDAAAGETRTDALGHVVEVGLSRGGRLRTVRGAEGYVCSYGYDGNGRRDAAQVGGMGLRREVYDERGLVARRALEGSGPEGTIETVWERDAAGAVIGKTLPGGIVTGMELDALGRTITESVGGSEVLEYGYDEADADFKAVPRQVTDLESGALTVAVKLDAWSRAVSSATVESTPVGFEAVSGLATVPIGRSRSNAASYLNGGEPLSWTDGNGHAAARGYDAAVRATGTADQDGIGSSVSYDEAGRVVEKVDDRGNVTTYGYDGNGWLELETLPVDGGTVRYYRDANGNVLYETHGLNGQVYTLRYTYDGLDRRVERVDAAGHVTSTGYYPCGTVEHVTDADLRTVTYQYDGAGREVSATETPGGLCTTTTYHANGQVEHGVRGDGREEIYEYDDPRGRLTAKFKTGEGRTTYTYDGADLRLIADGNGKVTALEYDTLHRMVRETTAGGKVTERGYDAAGFLVRMRDPMGREFGYVNHDNGRRAELRYVYMGESVALGTFSYEGNVPTSDGDVSWSLDTMGRAKAVSAYNTTVAYEYNHPMGMMTRESFGTVDLSYTYDTGGRLEWLTDGNGNGAHYTRSSAGVVQGVAYSSGIDVDYQYTPQMYVSDLTYMKGEDVLAGFHAGYDQYGKRQTLELEPTGESFSYGYDSQFRLNSEVRTLNEVTTTTSYTHDLVSNRLTRTTASGTEAYHYDDDYQLTSITGVGATTFFRYDGNGNTVKKFKGVQGVATISYKNTSGSDRIYKLNGVPITFPVTDEDGTFEEVDVGLDLDSTFKLTVDEDQVDSSSTIEIDKITYVKFGGGGESFGIDVATWSESVTPIEDELAYNEQALVFGEASTDWIVWTTDYLESDAIDYRWDVLNRLEEATRRINGNARHKAEFAYAGMGWQAHTQNVHDYTLSTDDTRDFVFGLGGELLSETTSAGMRQYINGGLDHAMWTVEPAGGAGGVDVSRFWLTDVNGSVFGITDDTGSMIERQRFDAFGKREVTSVDGLTVQNTAIHNRTGFQGRTDIPETDLQDCRNRPYDPTIGRFLSRDPLGFVNGPGTGVFCGGDPVNRRDPMGTDWVEADGSGAVIWKAEGLSRSPFGTINDIQLGTLLEDGKTVRLSKYYGGDRIALSDLKSRAEEFTERSANSLLGFDVNMQRHYVSEQIAELRLDLIELSTKGITLSGAERARYRESISSNMAHAAEWPSYPRGDIRSAVGQRDPFALMRDNQDPLPEKNIRDAVTIGVMVGEAPSSKSTNLNSNEAVSKFGVYEIEVNEELYKIGKADLNRVTKSTGLPTRLHQQITKLERQYGIGAVEGKIVEDLGITTTQAAKNAEGIRLQEYFEQNGSVPKGNEKSFIPE